ncbi:DUF4333 domain-containing protein [Nocardioides campestrisoli]|uniref:DUF4333 domain-containing protein n=1 Tax=Nocardioides campestrisoli TaxID=2736757 RepID=UPI00163D5BAA|nr:DUF4333 domain-containing protein [Nocardioides campestrisoli]
MRNHGLTLRLATSTGSVLLLGLLTACSATASSVEASELEKHVTDNVTAADGVDLAVECPEDLEAEVDATASCIVDDGEGQTGVRFTTTEVDGEEVSFETVPFLAPETLETALTGQLEEQGFDVSDLACAEELDGVKDETTECTATSQGEEGTIAVTVTEVDGLRVGFSWKVVA